ncbi:MAG: UvrD-helicase domain-containing protein [Prevotella sp.]|nr:UvrD-helicase domain-containing protein [Prevotella sp.]
MTQTPTPLTVYKASAGSGKTFTLAVEYIKLLILDPQNYRYILAVTFTNKATEEMKTRILSQLYGIAHALSDSEDYMDRMREAYPRMTDDDIRTRANTAMHLILHHYNYFRVETIDSFFQSILRNLARELGLTANLQVGLNDTEVENEAVDNIIEGIQQDNDPLLSWLMEFVTEKMDEEKNWNVIGKIKEFGQNIFKEFYKTHQHDLRRIMTEPDFFKKYTSALRKMKQDAYQQMAKEAQDYQDFAAQHNLTESNYSNGSKSVPAYFAKLGKGEFMDSKIPNSYIIKGIANAASLLKKSDVNTPEGQLIISEVGPRLGRVEELRKRLCGVVNSVDLTLANINELRLLGRIEEEVSAINTANNNYPLSNTQKLLSDLIDKQDSPFIYEKTGGQLRYIMIDEFQDTSTVQWNNFKVLLDDCLAHNNGSLIVGDVKQSIYRWRNGDWRLLQGLSPDHDKRIRVQPLDTNYRSKRNIIRFNNAFFQLGAKLTSDDVLAELQDAGAPTSLLEEALDIRRAYADVAQKVSPRHIGEDESRAGSVTIRLLPSAEYEQNMVLEVKHTVEQLLSAGIAPGKIAVLVRKNKYIQLLANYFQQNPITVNGKEQMVSMVSDEAFRLDASLAVCTIVRAMYLLVHPEDRLATAALVKAYQKIEHGGEEESDTRLFVGNDDLRSLLPAEMLTQWNELLTTPLIDLAERLYQIFGLSRLDGQSAYVCAFFDHLSAFLQNHIAGIDELVKEWDDNLCGKSIHSDEVNGIRLLTVHKSKGLQFNNVIIPFCDWAIEKQSDVLWAKPGEAPYDQLPIVPVNLSAKKLQQSIYRDEYLSEHIKNLVDNLNVLYVAFTRAEDNLFIIGRSDHAQYPSALMSQVFEYKGSAPDGDLVQTEPQPVVSLRDFLPEYELETDENKLTTFRFGTLCPSEEKRRKESKNVFEQTEKGIRMQIRNYDARANFKQSNSSGDFIMPDEELEELEKRRSYIQTGNILHTLFASIKDRNDVDKAIGQLEFDGVLYDKPMTREELRRIIDDRLQSPEVAEWFAPGWQVFNECTILTLDEATGGVKEQRPDRVIYDGTRMLVIDFKTGKEQESHHVQVRRYMRLLREMGYNNISGRLWYIRTNRVVEVNDEA